MSSLPQLLAAIQSLIDNAQRVDTGFCSDGYWRIEPMDFQEVEELKWRVEDELSLEKEKNKHEHK